MKRWLLKMIPFLVGAVAGAGGLFGFQYLSGADAQTILQHLQGDSTAVVADSAAIAGGEAVDSLPSVAEVDTTGVAIDPLTLLPVDPATAEPGTVADTMGAYPADSLGGTGEDLIPTRRLAKFFGSMQAREAARVLEKMTDNEVEIILSQLGDREAATILSNLTPERAAQISQVVISGERSIR